MIKHLRARYHFARAQRAWERDEWEGCLAHLSRVESLAPLDPFRTAFKAQALIALREYAAAEQLLSRTISAIGRPQTAQERYIQIVCLLWRENGFRDRPDANLLWAEAQALDCSRMVKRYLLLRQPPEFSLARPATIDVR